MQEQLATPDTGVAADAAQYAALEKEFGDAAQQSQPEKASVEPAKTEPEKPQQQEAPKQQAPLPYEELDRRYRGLQGALGESRAETRAAKEAQERFSRQLEGMQEVIRRMQQPKEAPREIAPGIPEPPVLTNLRQELGQVAEQNAQITRQQQAFLEQNQKRTELEQIVRKTAASEQAFLQKSPDYYDAARHLMGARMSELELFYPDDSAAAQDAAARLGMQSVAELREAVFEQERETFLRQISQSGVDPAQAVYRLAQTRGYQAKKAAPAAPAAPQQRPADEKIAQMKKGMEAQTGLPAGGAPSNDPSIEELANLYLEDPEKADKMFRKMQEQGLLG